MQSTRVVNPPESVCRHFLPWDRPLLPQAVAFLAGDWAGGGPLDLSKTLVIVPTRQTGRRLREALAAHAAAHGSAAFPPRVMLPESLVAAAPGDAALASRLESLLAWTVVLRDVPLDEFRAVFPVDPPVRNVAWALRLAQEFVRLRRALAEGGLQLGDVAGRVGADFPEAERWRQIGELERRQTAVLAELGLRDRQAAEVAAAVAPAKLEDVERIVAIGAPDPLPLALRVLAEHARAIAVDILVFAPAEEAAAFDEWGRPLGEAWTRRVLELPEFEQRVHVCADPAAQAERIASLARGYGEPEGVLGVGVADAEVLPLLEGELEQAGLAAFNPEGRRREGDALHQLLRALAVLAREETFSAVEALGRCPDLLEFLRRSVAGFSAAEFLRDLDRLHMRHLPPTLAEARRHAATGRGEGERPVVGAATASALAIVEELREALVRGAFPKNAAEVLAALFGGRRFDLANPVDARAAESAGVWTEVMRELAAAEEKFEGIGAAEWWDVALRLYGEDTRYDDKREGAVELQGWLELLWEDAPHLVVAGFNDGRVPDAIVGDPFLPESLRERLGLKTNAARFARDAYLLQALAAWRSEAGTGRLDVFLGKTSAAGDPLRPSRLLLRCADEALAARVKFLFRPAEAPRATPPWQRAWRLVPGRVPAVERVAVTGMRGWLACPWRFYLGRVLRMEAVDPAKTELDVFDFGTLCHAALEAMGREEALRDCTDAAVLRGYLLDTLERAAAKRFGSALTLPLVVQVESARQRLSRVAEVQAQTRADGWVTIEVERPFELEVGGLVVSGKIDRVDRHEGTGALRVLDYKTSDRPVEPWQAHVRGVRREETAPEFARLTLNGRDYVWSDLQLPLYLRALAADGNGARLECGYFNLPKASTETGIRPWDDYTRELDESAWRCAEGVAAAMRAGEFWPPNENVREEWDDFAALFHHGVAASVAWEARR